MAIDEQTESPGTPPPTPTSTSVPPAPGAPRKSRPKRTFMLHGVDDMSCVHKFSAPGFREAAMKAASKGHGRILLRRCGTSEVREYVGRFVALDPPVVVARRGAAKPIEYHRKPRVEFVRAFQFSGNNVEDA